MHKDFNEYLTYWQTQYSANLCSAAELVSQVLLFGFDQFQSKLLFSDLKTESEIINFLNKNHWKGHTDRIRRALISWHLKMYPLVLLPKIPSPRELLELQAQGKRVVTLFPKIEDWQIKWGKFTAWEFTAHDLIHADHFFQDSQLHKKQTQFYQFILNNWEHPLIDSLHNESGFEYLISDMNSHPKHLLQTLSALVIEKRKENFCLEKKDRLPDIEEVYCQREFFNWQKEIGL